ncbi:hypothetical protein [Larkinella rosea]|uniref:Uncharacterized protein n=1 Tax=Larkinella rosea TaxID=2025312 RepID=A0A3P1BAD1_9BACT|nr:hypothetical protein [Larkinella rosea]RRA98076.1 hypothetical protein EHT25_30880 [Larkinella rosea]
MNYQPLPQPEKYRLLDHSVRLVWDHLTLPQINWLTKQAFYFKEFLFADLAYYGQIFSLDIKIGPDQLTTLYFPKSEVGTMTDEMIRQIIGELTHVPVEWQDLLEEKP